VNYTYDNNNRQASVTDWNGKQIAYTYKPNGLVASRQLPNGILSTYGYDIANRLSSLEHAKTGTVLAKFAYERDPLGNITKVTEEGSFFGTPTPTPSATATPTPTPTTAMSTPTPTRTPTITPTPTPTPTLSGPTATRTPTPTALPTPTPLTTGPDLVITNISTIPSSPTGGQSTTVVATVKNQGTVGTGVVALNTSFYYDLAVPPTTQSPQGQTVMTVSLAPGQQTQFTTSRTFTTGAHTIAAFVDRSNQIGETNNANNTLGPQNVQVAFTGATIARSPSDYITKLFSLLKTRPALAQQSLPQFITTFSYDALSRIKTADYPDNTSYAYEYDKADNRKSMTLTIGSTVGTGNNTFNADSELTQMGSNTFTYDASGNRKQKITSTGTTNHTYNFENKLTLFDVPSGSDTTYIYDGNQNRIQKRVGTTQTRYVNDISAELTRVLAETNSYNTITKSYIYGNGLVSQGSTGDTSRYYYLEDGQGNARFLTDYNGAKSRSNEYDPYGSFRSASGLAAMHMLYQTQQSDVESGLYYLRARSYDPITGTFLSRDSIKGTLGNPQTQNPYTYSLNNPVNLGDPSGMEYINIGVGAGTIISVGRLSLPIGAVAGILIDDKGDVYPYYGAGLSTPGLGASLTRSNSEVDTGYSVQVSGQHIGAGSYSKSIEGNSSSWEYGGGAGAGVSGQIVRTCDKIASLW